MSKTSRNCGHSGLNVIESVFKQQHHHPACCYDLMNDRDNSTSKFLGLNLEEHTMFMLENCFFVEHGKNDETVRIKADKVLD